MEQNLISARVNLTPYSNKVLGIIKLKFDLNDKSQAINKFIDIFGEDIIEKDATYEYSKKVMKIADKHFMEYGNKKMSADELDELCEV